MLLLIFINSLFILYAFRISDEFTPLIEETNKSGRNYKKLDEYGIISIHNLTIDKVSAEIGENITVSSLYSLLCNPGYQREYGMIGIDTPSWFEYENSLIDGVSYHNVTEIISLSPNYFNASDVCNGRVKIKIFNMSNPMDFIIQDNVTENSIELKKAQLNFSLINQSPSIVFSNDLLNYSFFISNEHTEKYVFSNGYFKINVSNGNLSQSFSKYTDSKGFLNFTINCSVLGAGNYTILLENNETSDYNSTPYSIQIEILDEDQSINCTLLNSESIYTAVDYDLSDFSKAIFLIETDFDANISYFSDLENGNCSKIGNQHNASLKSPEIAGIYQVYFIAYPLLKGRNIQFNYSIEVKHRPIELNTMFLGYENQTNVACQIKVMDVLVNHTAKTNNSISIIANFNKSNWDLGSTRCDSDGNALLIWDPPSRIEDAFISLNFRFNTTPVYQSYSLIKNITLTELHYFGPLHEFATKNITFRAVLFALNGTPIPHQIICLKIDDQYFNLTTDINGEINFSLTTPSYATKLKIEFQFLGSGDTLSSNLILNIEIKLDLLQQIWDSIGFILVGIGIAFISLLYLKKTLTKRNLSTLDVK